MYNNRWENHHTVDKTAISVKASLSCQKHIFTEGGNVEYFIKSVCV